MQWRFSMVSWSSRIFPKWAKILCFYNWDFYNWDYNRPAATPVSRLSHTECPQVTIRRKMNTFCLFGKCQEEGDACVCVGCDSVSDTAQPHTLQERANLFMWYNSRFGSLAPDTHILGLYAYLISLPLLAVLSFFPAYSSFHYITLPPFTSHPLWFLRN